MSNRQVMGDQGDDKRTLGMPPGLSARRIPSQNVVSRLMSRQMFGPHYRYCILYSDDPSQAHLNICLICYLHQAEVSEHLERVPPEHRAQLYPGQCGEAALLPQEVQS